jgi:hypothetical protein
MSDAAARSEVADRRRPARPLLQVLHEVKNVLMIRAARAGGTGPGAEPHKLMHAFGIGTRVLICRALMDAPIRT